MALVAATAKLDVAEGALELEIEGAENIEATQEGDWLVLRINTKKTLGVSSSQKSINIATTHGNQKVCGGTLGLNFYKKNPKYKK